MSDQVTYVLLVVLGMDLTVNAASLQALSDREKLILAEQTANSIVGLETMMTVFPVMVLADGTKTIDEMIAARSQGIEALGLEPQRMVRAARVRLQNQNIGEIQQALLHLGGI